MVLNFFILYITGSLILIFGEDISIFSLKTYSPSLNLPCFICSNIFKLSSGDLSLSLLFIPGSVSVPLSFFILSDEDEST